MFVGIKFASTDGIEYFEPINIFYIQQLKFFNVKNPDGGCYVVMKDGQHHYTPESMDILLPKIKEEYINSSAIILSQLGAEVNQMILDEDKRKKVVRKRRVK